MMRSPISWRRSLDSLSSQITTVLAPISSSESKPNAPRATEWAVSAVPSKTRTPITFQDKVAHSRVSPRRRSAA